MVGEATMALVLMETSPLVGVELLGLGTKIPKYLFLIIETLL